MRDYAKISPQFWIGDTGKKLRGHLDAQVMAAYLLSCPHANMIGLFYLPMTFISHETGLTLQGASKALQRCIEAHFCGYDEAAEVVWVYEMAKFQIADALKAEDKRCKGVENEYENIQENKFLGAFFDRYSEAFHLTKKRGNGAENTSPIEAPSKPHRSQEQEQEQEQKQDRRSAFTLPEWVPGGAWAGWVEIRRKAKWPLTDRALSLALKELEQLKAQGHDPARVLDTATLKGWRSLYPPKDSDPHPVGNQFAGVL